MPPEPYVPTLLSLSSADLHALLSSHRTRLTSLRDEVDWAWERQEEAPFGQRVERLRQWQALKAYLAEQEKLEEKLVSLLQLSTYGPLICTPEER